MEQADDESRRVEDAARSPGSGFGFGGVLGFRVLGASWGLGFGGVLGFRVWECLRRWPAPQSVLKKGVLVVA